MALEQIAKLTPENALYELQRVNYMGDQLFEYRLFPNRYKFPDVIDNSMTRQRVLDFFDRVQQGLPYVTRGDDPDFDPGLDVRKFIEDTITGHAGVDDVLASLGIAVQDEVPEVQVPDPNVLPSVRHMMVALGLVNKMEPGDLPYVDEFHDEAKRFWGRELTVATIREMVDELTKRVHISLYGGSTTNYRELPIAQVFNVGSRLSTNILRQVHFKEQYKAI